MGDGTPGEQQQYSSCWFSTRQWQGVTWKTCVMVNMHMKASARDMRMPPLSYSYSSSSSSCGFRVYGENLQHSRSAKQTKMQALGEPVKQPVQTGPEADASLEDDAALAAFVLYCHEAWTARGIIRNDAVVADGRPSVGY